MQLLFQIKNLLYATVFSSIAHLPHFPLLFLMASVVVVCFSGVALLITHTKAQYLHLAYYYVSIAVFVIVVDIFVRLQSEYVTAIFFVAFVFLLSSIVGFWKKRQILCGWIKAGLTNKLQYGVILLIVILSTFFMSKFIYDNGLHDEYLHHAVVEDMVKTGKWPIRDELRPGIYLHNYYHYGWYYLVLLVHVIFGVSVESALDITKLALFIPLVPLLYVFSSKYLRTRWIQSIGVALLLLLQGPALFFFDAYSGNVFFLQGNEIIYEPLFFQLAGITWFGVVFLFAFLMVAYDLMQHANRWYSVVFTLYSVWSFYLLNKAYLLICLPTLILLFLYVYRKHLHTIFLKRKKFIFVALTFILIGLFGLVISVKYFSPYLFMLLKGESGIPFVRSIDQWGFPFSSLTGLSFQPVVSLGSLKAFGILPILIAIILVIKIVKEKNKIATILIGAVMVFLWITPVILNFSGSELALNKFYIPALWVCLMVIIHFSLRQSHKIQTAVLVLLCTSLLAPTMYFASISLPGIQQYWNYSDEIIEYLSAKDGNVRIAIDDFEYGKYLMNTLDTQLVSIHAKSIDITEFAEYEVTIKKRESDVPLAHTDTHYLYAK